MDPLFICQSWPDVMRLCNDTFVRGQNDLCSLWMQVEGTQDQNKPAEACEALAALLPIVIKIEQKHLWFRRLQDAITKLLDL